MSHGSGRRSPAKALLATLHQLLAELAAVMSPRCSITGSRQPFVNLSSLLLVAVAVVVVVVLVAELRCAHERADAPRPGNCSCSLGVTSFDRRHALVVVGGGVGGRLYLAVGYLSFITLVRSHIRSILQSSTARPGPAHEPRDGWWRAHLETDDDDDYDGDNGA